MAISAWPMGVYFLVELGIGVWASSIRRSRTPSTSSRPWAAWWSRSEPRASPGVPADEERSFGWCRAELLGTLVNGGFLLGTARVVIMMGTMRLCERIDLPTGPMLLAVADGLVTELVSLGLI